MTETNISDPASNHARTRVDYAVFNLADGTSCRYPSDTYEYQADASTVLHRSHVDYQMGSTYTNRRIIGLPSVKYACDGAQGEVPCNDPSGASLVAKVSFQYDEQGSIQGNDAPVQHDDADYGASLVPGRANLSSVKRYDVVNTGQFTMNSAQYNTAGSVVATLDPLQHGVTVSYADQFSANGTTLDSGMPLTLAYPTTVKDPDSYSSSVRYNYDFGAATWKQTPLPNVTDNQPGPQQVVSFDSIGRLDRVTSLVNNAYTRYIYGPNYVETFATVNTVADEAHSLQVFDGHGRLIAKATNHPGSVGGFSGQLFTYDQMGQMVKTSNPTETAVTISGVPIQPYSWVAAGDDAQAGWVYTQQTYDWKGRRLVTTNPGTTGNPADTTTKSASYSGCGCAGGEVVTLTDEGTIDSGVAKRRQQKIYSDVIGRTVKTEVLNWESGSVYSTTVNTYNARDQVTLLRQFQGTAPSDLNDLSCPSGTCQQTTISFDGYGRLKTKHVPEQQADPNNAASTEHTTWDYNADDTVQKVTDARNATMTYNYNNRHLVTGITYGTPAGVAATPSISSAYDAAGNRTSMTQTGPQNNVLDTSSYQVDQLSRMTSETHHFNDLAGTSTGGNYTLSYGYNLGGELTSVTDQSIGTTVNYVFDSTGRLTAVNGSGFPNFSIFASNFQYRAWGAIKDFDYSNGVHQHLGFNNRLQLTASTFSNVRVGSNQSARRSRRPTTTMLTAITGTLITAMILALTALTHLIMRADCWMRSRAQKRAAARLLTDLTINITGTMVSEM